MSHSHLPEDLADWPRDPFQLLGVDRTASERTIKKAYTKLIRTFKPEHYPDQFQRIRFAFESATTPDPYQQLWEVQHDEQRADDESSLPDSALPDFGRTPDTDAEYREVWKTATDGSMTEAYAKLLSLQRENPSHEETYLQLYWLLWIRPEIDTERGPVTWLIDGIRQCLGSDSLLELYHRELKANPREVASERCAQLIASDLSARKLARLLPWRWDAARRLRRFDLIASDATNVLQRLPMDDLYTRSNLLFDLVDQLIWSRDHSHAKLVKEAIKELELTASSELGGDYRLDRIDLLLHIAEAWHGVAADGTNESLLLQLVPVAWLDSPHEKLDQLLPALKFIAQDPILAVRTLDGLAGHGFGIVYQLCKFVEEFYYQYLPVSDGPALETQKLAKQFIRVNRAVNYRLFREETLKLCLRERISPNEFLGFADEQNEADCVWAQALESDCTIRLAYAASAVMSV